MARGVFLYDEYHFLKDNEADRPFCGFLLFQHLFEILRRV